MGIGGPSPRRSDRERRIAADAVRVSGLIVIVSTALVGNGFSAVPLIALGFLVGAAVVAERLSRRRSVVAVVEGTAALMMALGTPLGAPTDAYIMVVPLAAGLSLGLRSAFWVCAGQLVVLGASSVVDAGPAEPVVALLVLMGLALGTLGAGVGALLHRTLLRISAHAATSERRRLAAEIHDGIAQDLAVLAHRIDMMLFDDPASVPAEGVEAAGREIRRTLGDTRWVIHDLRGGRLPDIGVGAALTDHVRRAAEVSDLDAHLAISVGAHLPVDVELQLLRIAQEAVTNVRKHARATNLWVTLESTRRSALLVVADDGRAPAASGSRNGIGGHGLSIMQERAESVGAQLDWRRREGGGTVVEVRWTRRGPFGMGPALLGGRSRESASNELQAQWTAREGAVVGEGARS